MDTPDGGEESLTRFTDALEQFQARCSPHGRTETVRPTEATGRAVAAGVDARRPVPQFDRVDRDGVAVRARETVGAAGRSPVRVETATPPIDEGEATPVQAGETLPAGADAVVSDRHVTRRDGQLELFETVPDGAGVTRTGADVAAGDPIVDAGDRLSPVAVTLLRWAGIDEVSLFEPPAVHIVPTGNRLVTGDPTPGETVETNSRTIATLVEAWGGNAICHDVASADEALGSLPGAGTPADGHEADIIVTTGSTAGTDSVVSTVAEHGVVDAHGLAIEPGRSLALGTLAETPVLMLPGFPSDCLVDAVQFLRPAIAWVGGWSPPPVPTVRARLTGKLRSEPGTRSLAGVSLEPSPDAAADWGAAPTVGRQTERLSAVAATDGWVVIEADEEGVPAGTSVSVQQWDWTD